MLSAGFLSYIISKMPLGLSKVASIGNKSDVNETEILEYLIQDPDTRVIGMYLESISQGKKFFQLAKSADKPIVVLKGGSSPLGAQAAYSHTASLAQDDALLEGIFHQAKIIRVKGLVELMEIVRAFSIYQPEKKSKARIAIITFSGGAGVVASDRIYEQGMKLARLSKKTTAQVKTVFPEWMEPANPLDIYPAIEKNGPQITYQTALNALFQDPEVDAIFLHSFAPPINVPIINYEWLAEQMKKSKKPVVAWIMGHTETAKQIEEELRKRGIIVVEEMVRGLRVLRALLLKK